MWSTEREKLFRRLRSRPTRKQAIRPLQPNSYIRLIYRAEAVNVGFAFKSKLLEESPLDTAPTDLFTVKYVNSLLILHALYITIKTLFFFVFSQCSAACFSIALSDASEQTAWPRIGMCDHRLDRRLWRRLLERLQNGSSNGYIYICEFFRVPLATCMSFPGYFRCACFEDDSVNSLASDSKNDVLIAGDTAGSVSMWNIRTYCTDEMEMEVSQ